MPTKQYGSNQFFNKVNDLLGGKYSSEIASLMSDTESLKQTKIQSLIMLEVLQELRRLNNVPIGVNPSASNIPKGT